ncbi:hypothetical protein [Granulicella sp. S156]|jgi:hypothetical protein|uniref:hypothetical protein n=1 Tax=Granulicella sp. S156 TaxID=1747224 RepID=UPI00131CD6FD|nr:hypothetical protein [Granulicella sp. S156]
MKRFRIIGAVLWMSLTFCGRFVVAQQQVTATPEQVESLKHFLDHYIADGSTETKSEQQPYRYAFVHLSGDGRLQAIAYLTGHEWCGSGGCTTLVVMQKALSYVVVGDISISQLPIRILPTKTNGWRDLGVEVWGGGILNPYEARLPFNGRRYASNPTVVPAQRLHKEFGEILIPKEQ